MAVSAALQKQITDQQVVVDQAYNDLQTAITDRDNFQAVVDELKRELQVHLSNGDSQDASIVQNQRLPPALSQLNQAIGVYNGALSKYKTELNTYLGIKNKLTPTDRAKQDAQDASDPALSSTGNVNSAPPQNQTQATKPTGVPADANYSKSNTTWWIVGGIVISLVIIGIIIYKRKK